MPCRNTAPGKTFANPTSIDDRFDINRDRQVNATDMLIVRDHSSTLGGLLNLIAPVANGSLVGKQNTGIVVEPVAGVEGSKQKTTTTNVTPDRTADVDPAGTDYDRSLALHYWIAQQRLASDSHDEPLATKRLDELFAQLDELLS